MVNAVEIFAAAGLAGTTGERDREGNKGQSGAGAAKQWCAHGGCSWKRLSRGINWPRLLLESSERAGMKQSALRILLKQTYPRIHRGLHPRFSLPRHRSQDSDHATFRF